MSADFILEGGSYSVYNTKMRCKCLTWEVIPGSSKEGGRSATVKGKMQVTGVLVGKLLL